MANGVVYVVGYDGNFYALNSSTGDLLWMGTAAYGTFNAPVVANGIAYFGADLMYAFHLPGH